MSVKSTKINSCGTKYWYQNGELHRLDGPAMELTNGSKFWFYKDYDISNLTNILEIR